MKKDVKFVYCQVAAPADISALALVRFTSYDSDDKALAVEQVTYQELSLIHISAPTRRTPIS